MNIKMIVFLLMSLALIPISALAQHNPDAHTHGKGHMTIVFENGHLLMEMKTPAANMLGFEHKPNSDTQWKAFEALSKTLNEPNELITLSPDCELKNSSVNLPFKRAEKNKASKYDDSHAHQKHNKHEKNHHKKEHHDNEHHNKHHHEEDHNHKDEKHAGHSDIKTEYEWHCKNSAAPKITFKYFSKYPGFETIVAEWIVNGRQGMNRLKKDANTLDFKK